MSKSIKLPPFLETEMLEKRMRLWRETHLQEKKPKHVSIRPLVEDKILKKCTLLWREAHLELKKKVTIPGPLLQGQMSKHL